jgi:hypothetical protein
MKFRGKLEDIISITQLSSIQKSHRTILTSMYLTDVVATLAKNVKVCVIRLNSDKMCFVMSDKNYMNMWCELNQVDLLYDTVTIMIMI